MAHKWTMNEAREYIARAERTNNCGLTYWSAKDYVANAGKAKVVSAKEQEA